MITFAMLIYVTTIQNLCVCVKNRLVTVVTVFFFFFFFFYCCFLTLKKAILTGQILLTEFEVVISKGCYIVR